MLALPTASSGERRTHPQNLFFFRPGLAGSFQEVYGGYRGISEE